MADSADSPGGETRRNIRVPNEDHPGSDGDQDIDLLELARKEARFARHTAYASLLLAGVSFCAAMGTMSHHWHPSAQINEATMLDETIYPTVPGIDGMKPGWAQTLTNAVVREGVKPDSPKVAIIRQRAKVLVEEVHGRRVRISKPVHGWLSSASTDGIEILRDLRSEQFKQESYFDERLKEMGAKPGNITEGYKNLEREVLGFKKQQPKLLKSLEGVTKHLADKAKIHAYADVASDGATKVVSNVKDAVENMDVEKFDAEKVANDLMKGKIVLPNNQHIDLKTPTQKEGEASDVVNVVE